MVKDLLNVLMDDINDTNMLIDYYLDSDHQELSQYYHSRAKKRYDEAVESYAFVKRMIGLDQKVKDGDAIAEALCSYINNTMNDIKKRMEWT